jgi:hypothetical protein
MMADGDELDGGLDAESQSMIDELLEAGFSYTGNGRVEGFATEETDPEETDDGSVDGGPSADDALDGGRDGTGRPGGDGTGGEDDGPVGRGAHSGRLELKGTPLTELEADSLLHLRQLLINDPELAAQVNGYLEQKQGRAQPPAPVVDADAEVDKPADLPDYIDPDDETTVALWREVQALKAQTARTEQVATGTVEQVQADALHRQREQDIANAVHRFQEMHPDFTEEDINHVRLHTASTVNVPGVMANFPGDPVEGLVRAMEIGSMTAEGVRDKVLGTPKKDPAAEDTKRQRSLSALSGGGGATRRTPPKQAKPAGWSDVAKKLAEEISALGGTQ